MSNNSKEYQRKNYYKYWGNPEAIKSRVMRTLARRKLEKQGRVSKGDGKEVDHINGTKAGNGNGNLRVISRLKNRRMGQKKATKSQLRNNGK